MEDLLIYGDVFNFSFFVIWWNWYFLSKGGLRICYDDVRVLLGLESNIRGVFLVWYKSFNVERIINNINELEKFIYLECLEV